MSRLNDRTSSSRSMTAGLSAVRRTARPSTATPSGIKTFNLPVRDSNRRLTHLVCADFAFLCDFGSGGCCSCNGQPGHARVFAVGAPSRCCVPALSSDNEAACGCLWHLRHRGCCGGRSPDDVADSGGVRYWVRSCDGACSTRYGGRRNGAWLARGVAGGGPAARESAPLRFPGARAPAPQVSSGDCRSDPVAAAHGNQQAHPAPERSGVPGGEDARLASNRLSRCRCRRAPAPGEVRAQTLEAISGRFCSRAHDDAVHRGGNGGVDLAAIFGSAFSGSIVA